MPLASALKQRVLEPLRLRLATPASRFRLAVATGFVVAAVGFISVVVGDGDGFAENWFGLGGILGLQQPVAQNDIGEGVAAPRRQAQRRRGPRVEPARFLRSVERSHSLRAAGDAPVELGRQSMCVRLCDGFAFPVGTYHGEQDRASHEATCRSECPGARTALYVLPSGADTMDSAIRVGTDKSYSELPYAFHYTTVMSDACSCHPPEGNRVKSLLRDFTLRRGDAVMTASGVKVFQGGGHFPFKRNDFIRFAASRDLSKGTRGTFRAIEKASLVPAPDVVARTTSPQPAAPLRTAITPKLGTHGLEQQASLTPPAAPHP